MDNTFTITIDLYESRIHVLNNISDEDFQVYCKHHFGQIPERLTCSGTCWTLDDEAKKEHYLIDYRRKLKKNSESMNLIVHEASHAVNSIMNKVRILYDPENEEPYCYLLGYITEKIFEGLFEK